MRKLLKARLGDSGYSLIELMIAITVVAIGVLSLAGLFPIAMQKVSKGDLESRATFHAQGKLEELKRVPWNQLLAGAGTDTTDVVFVRNWTILVDQPAPGMKRVDVRVNWSDARGPRTVVMSSFLSDSGM